METIITPILLFKIPYMLPEELLRYIEKSGSFPINKDTSEEEMMSLNKLRAYGLVQRRNKFSWELSTDGYLAIEKGGFENFKKHTEKSSATNHIENYSVVNGDKNIVHQTSKTKSDEFKKKDGLWSKFWWLIIIPLLIGIVLILLERNILNF